MDIQISHILQRIEALESKRMTQRDYINRSVKQRAIDGLIIFTGLAADLPSGNTEVQAYFSTDDNKLHIYNTVTKSWKSVTLS